MAASDGIMHLVPLIKIKKDQEINIESMSTELIRKPYNKTCFFLKTHTNYGLNSSYGLSKPWINEVVVQINRSFRNKNIFLGK